MTYEPCLCGAIDCPRCYPQSYQDAAYDEDDPKHSRWLDREDEAEDRRDHDREDKAYWDGK